MDWRTTAWPPSPGVCAFCVFSLFMSPLSFSWAACAFSKCHPCTVPLVYVTVQSWDPYVLCVQMSACLSLCGVCGPVREPGGDLSRTLQPPLRPLWRPETFDPSQPPRYIRPIVVYWFSDCICLSLCPSNLFHLSFSGCQVAGPWDSCSLDGLSEQVQDLRLCSQRLNKLDREVLQQTWGQRTPMGHFLSRDAKCLLTVAPSLWGRLLEFSHR
jgi:hypothetical protein